MYSVTNSRPSLIVPTWPTSCNAFVWRTAPLLCYDAQGETTFTHNLNVNQLALAHRSVWHKSSSSSRTRWHGEPFSFLSDSYSFETLVQSPAIGYISNGPPYRQVSPFTILQNQLDSATKNSQVSAHRYNKNSLKLYSILISFFVY